MAHCICGADFGTFTLDGVDQTMPLCTDTERHRRWQINQAFVKWDRRFLELAKHIAEWSKDPSTKVGAVLVDERKIVVGMGYNGFARNVQDTDARLNNRELKYKLVVHAEVNAILQAGRWARGSSLYVFPTFMSPPICHDCAKFAIQAGVRTVVGYEADETTERAQRWKDSIELSRQMFREAGVEWRIVQPA